MRSVSGRRTSWVLLAGASLGALTPISAVYAQTQQEASPSNTASPPVTTSAPTAGEQATGAASNSETDPASPAGEIVVTGTRASLNRSLDLKKQTIGIVDSISAEDIGKFPDQNVAESLQHIPGVSIDRSGGEGHTITVRGFGPQFNTVLLNGRLLATENPGREFSFDILPSELISAAEVYKSSTADQQDGGIGSTVILRTARPLDHPGFHASVSGAAKFDSTTQQGDARRIGVGKRHQRRPTRSASWRASTMTSVKAALPISIRAAGLHSLRPTATAPLGYRPITCTA